MTAAPALREEVHAAAALVAGKTSIKVYSNCESVELFVNGESIGRRRGEDGVFVWNDVMLNNRENRVRAEGKRGGKNYRDSVAWNTKP